MARSAKIPSFTLTDPFFLAGKSGAACGLALLMAETFAVPDRVTASFVAVLCCSPAALMGMRTSGEQLTGSLLGGLFGSLAAYLALPQVIGVPVALALAILCTHAIGFHRGTIAAAFTALFLQIVSFGDPLATFAFRIEAVAIAAISAFVVNVLVSAFFYRSLFRKRLRKLRRRLDLLLGVAAERGPVVLHGFFAVVTQLDNELAQAVRELGWRRNQPMVEELHSMQEEARWLRDYAHFLVELEFAGEDQAPEVRAFLGWLLEREGKAPKLGPGLEPTASRILAHLSREPASGAP